MAKESSASLWLSLLGALIGWAGIAVTITQYKNPQLGRFALILFLVAGAAIIVWTIVRMLSPTTPSSRKRIAGPRAALIVLLGVSIFFEAGFGGFVAWQRISFRLPCSSTMGSKRSVHLFPKEYVGDVYVTVVPKPKQIARDHHLCIQWGGWRADVALRQVPKRGTTVSFLKRRPDAVAVEIVLMPEANVSFRTSHRGESLNIETEWTRTR